MGSVISQFRQWRELLPQKDDYHFGNGQWQRDLLAGITVGVVALPLALGFGAASGVGPAAGLVTAVIAGVVAAVFGGSHLQISGPTGAMTVVLLPVIAQHGAAMVPLLAVLAGVLVLLMGCMRLGRVVDLIPWPVVEGFTIGIGVIITLQQIPLALDVDQSSSESTLIGAYETLKHVNWSISLPALIIAVAVVLFQFLLRKIKPSLPSSLIAIVLATIIVEAISLNVRRIGVLPSSLPAPVLPTMSWSIINQLAPAAVAVAALAALESLLSARVADGMAPDVARTKPDRELFGQGLANIASGLFGGLPATGAIARTAVNVRSGGKTRISAITHAVVLLTVIVSLGPIVGLIPLSALAGVLIFTGLRMIDVAVAKRIWNTTRADRLTLIATFATTVLFDLITAVLLGVVLAAALSLRHMASTSLVRREYLPVATAKGLVDFPTEELHNQVAVFRVDGALFYGDAGRFIRIVSDVENVSAVIIRTHRMRVMDASGSEALRQVTRSLARRGIHVVVQGLNAGQVHSAVSVGAITQDQAVAELTDAVDWVCAKLGKAEQAHATVKESVSSLFVYGNFTQPHVHYQILGRRLIGTLDLLPRHRLRMVEITDPQQQEVVKAAQQPGAVETQDAADLIAGTLITVSDFELAAIEAFNSGSFVKKRVTLASGKTAWAFVVEN